MMTILYNATMILVDAVALFIIHEVRTLRSFIVGLGLVAIQAGLLAVMFEFKGDDFGILRLFAYGVFLHGAIVLIGLMIILSRSYKKVAMACGIAVVFLELIGVDAFFIEPYWLEVSHVRIPTPKLERPLKIVVLADFQTDVIGNYERKVLRRIMEEKADMILLAGDYIQESNRARRKKLREELRAFLREVGFSAPLGIYAVEGNTDTADWPEIFQGFPVTVMRNTRTMELADFRITGLSMEDSRNPSLQIPESGPFHIIFGHYPDFALGHVRADLFIAGHTHGGQVRLPFLGPVITLSRVPRKWAAGVTDLGNGRTLIVSRGTGMERDNAPRLRFLCRPELVVVELMPEKKMADVK